MKNRFLYRFSVGRKVLAVIAAGTLCVSLLTGCGSELLTEDTDLSSESSTHAESTDSAVQEYTLQGESSQGESSQSEGRLETVETTEPFTMFFTGDVLMRSATESIYDSEGVEGLLSPELLQEMQTADLCMINQEFPFGVGGTKAPDKQFTFKSDPKYVQALLDMGVDIVTLANNHVLDFGPEVLSQTFETLDNAGIDYVGAGESIERAKAWQSYEINGTSIAILGASRVIPVVEWNVDNAQPGVFCTYDTTQLVEQIELAEAEHDLVIVAVHWGIEGAEYPEEYQRLMAREYIDAGADLIVGNHPHVIQGVEYYKDTPIVYSLGNYLFNQNNQPTAVLKVYVDELQHIRLQMIPIATSSFHVYASEGQAATNMIDYIEELSYALSLDEEGYVCPIIVCDGEYEEYGDDSEE